MTLLLCIIRTSITLNASFDNLGCAISSMTGKYCFEFHLRQKCTYVEHRPDSVITLYNGIFASESSQNCPSIGQTSRARTAILPGASAATPSVIPGTEPINTVTPSLLDFLYYTTIFYVPDPVITSRPPNIWKRTVIAKSKRIVK